MNDEPLKARDAGCDIGAELSAMVPDLTAGSMASNTAASQRLGVAKGAFQMPDSIDSYNEEVHRLFPGQT